MRLLYGTDQYLWRTGDGGLCLSPRDFCQGVLCNRPRADAAAEFRGWLAIRLSLLFYCAFC